MRAFDAEGCMVVLAYMPRARRIQPAMRMGRNRFVRLMVREAMMADGAMKAPADMVERAEERRESCFAPRNWFFINIL